MMNTNVAFITLSCVAIFLIAIPNHVESVQVSLRAVRKILPGSKNVNVVLKYENKEPNSFCIKNWYLPKKELEQPIFTVSCHGKEVPYTGKMVKRPAPTISDTIILKPGDKLETTIDLSRFYDMKKNCAYSITFPLEFDSILLTGTDQCSAVAAKPSKLKANPSVQIRIIAVSKPPTQSKPKSL